jgi:cupin 2 domain-containing protein
MQTDEGPRNRGPSFCYEPSMTNVQRGRLDHPSTAPTVGERAHELVNVRNLAIEQVLSGDVEPMGYLQAEDEWALVLSGAAVLEVGGDPIELAAHEWIFLPAGTPHRVVRTERGTSWITVKLAPATR